MELGARTFKRVSLEAGGKAPVIVFPDANLEKAMDAVAVGIFLYAGQSCTAGSRLLLERSIHDRFLEGLIERAEALRSGSPLDDAHPARADGLAPPARSRPRLRRARAGRRARGSSSAASGSAASGRPASGWQPTIFDDVAPTMTIAREEIFGPVLSVIPFDTEAEALALANDNEFGLGSAVWTTRPRPGDPRRAAAARRRRVGQHPLRPAGREPVRRRQAERDRTRARDGGPRRLPRVEARLHRQLADVPHPLTCRRDASPRRRPGRARGPGPVSLHVRRARVRRDRRRAARRQPARRRTA